MVPDNSDSPPKDPPPADPHSTETRTPQKSREDQLTTSASHASFNTLLSLRQHECVETTMLPLQPTIKATCDASPLLKPGSLSPPRVKTAFLPDIVNTMSAPRMGVATLAAFSASTTVPVAKMVFPRLLDEERRSHIDQKRPSKLSSSPEPRPAPSPSSSSPRSIFAHPYASLGDIPSPSRLPLPRPSPRLSAHPYHRPTPPPSSPGPPSSIRDDTSKSIAGPSSSPSRSSSVGAPPSSAVARTTPGTEDQAHDTFIRGLSPRKMGAAGGYAPPFANERLRPPSSQEYQPHKQSDLEKALRTVRAPEGAIHPTARKVASLPMEGIQMYLERVQGPGHLAKQKRPEPRQMWRVDVQCSYARDYLERLEDAYGPGDAMRGEGMMPEIDAEDAGYESVDELEQREVREWISQIQVVVRGKRKLVREDLLKLSRVLREIVKMDHGMSRKIAADLPMLRESLNELSRCEIPFGDEFRLRVWAGNMLRHWPT
ncbi:Cyclin-domain-containing protein [Mycena kentingensis (nom. inval.)]|nr:Cyclin-domain-containing protein [Mycena kentingensis (nom. inval.)]